MRLYFPELVRAIDTNVEVKRAQTLQFAPADSAPKTADPASEKWCGSGSRSPRRFPMTPKPSQP